MNTYIFVCFNACVLYVCIYIWVSIICMYRFFHLKHLQRNGQFIEWKHLQQLYEKLMRMAAQSKGLSLVPKLKEEHISLTSYSWMRVDLAAQVSPHALCVKH